MGTGRYANDSCSNQGSATQHPAEGVSPARNSAAVAAATAGDLTGMEKISLMRTQKTPAQLMEKAMMKAHMAANTSAALCTASDIASTCTRRNIAMDVSSDRNKAFS